MTSSNFNKFMQTNLKLNSKILSKNTNEIVNTCIGKLYQQMPLTFKNSLQQLKIGVSGKSANYGPFEKLQMQDRKQQQSTANGPLKANSSIFEAQMLCNLTSMSKKPAGPTSKKLLKAHGDKIYNRKRYYSSASSSNGNLLCGKVNKQLATQATNKLDKAVLQGSTFMLQKPVSVMVTTRNQQKSSNVDIKQRAMKLSRKIQRVTGKINDFRATNVTKTTNVLQSLPPAEMDYRNFKEDKEKLKDAKHLNKLQSAKQIKKISTSLKQYNKSLPFTKPVKPLTAHKGLWGTALESRDFRAAGKENKLKTSSKSRVCSSAQQQQYQCVGFTNALRNYSPKQQQAYKLNENIAPSAAYCLLKPTRFSPMKYVN